MARPWRLRHKLILGLLLVVAGIGLLLGGAMFGLSAYVEAARKTGNKLSLLTVVIILRDHLNQIGSGGPFPTRDAERTHIRSELAKIRGAVTVYRQMRDADDAEAAEWEQAYLPKLEGHIRTLDAAVTDPAPNASGTGDRRVIDEPHVRAAYTDLLHVSTELLLVIKGHIEDVNHRAEANHRRGMAIAVSATVFSVLLVLTLLYYFNTWVFRPLKQIQEGVRRVHAGHFGDPIQLKSDDELEELANEFNAMTGRLQASYTDLARQVNERSRQLVRSERMVSVGFLAAGVAHEINNPLASIAFCAEGMERRLADPTATDDEAVARYLKVIQQEAFRCKQITQKLLDFSRSGEKKREPTDLGRLVQDVVDVTRVLPHHRAKAVEYTPRYILAPISPPDVKSVVLNLIVNALESMDDGGTLTIALSQADGYAEIAFRDTGCGMAADVLENIFEPFFTRRRTGNGTGLGLSISHQIIDQHGGTVTAASDGPGRGSVFVVRLPVQESQTPRHGDTETRRQNETAVPAVLPFPNRVAA